MKITRLYLLSGLLLVLSGLSAQNQMYITDGYVVVEDLFLPVEDQIVEIKSEAGNVISSVLTDETGYFKEALSVAEGEEFIILEMARNCSGEVILYNEQLELNNSHLSHIFFVCEDIPCEAKFNYEQQTPNSLIFDFTDVSLMDVDSWLWDFGDGNTSTQQNPVHVYSDQGSYIVTLTVMNENCTDETQRNVIVNYKSILAKFSFEQVNQGEQPAINFTNNSIGFFLSNYWDFGDDGFSYAVNPKHVYNEPGDYNVSLTIFTQFNYSTLRKTVHVTPIPSCFSLFNHEQILSSNLTLQFEDISAGKSILFWYWQFGDGQSSEEQNPEHIYQETGTYDVSLRVISTTGQSFYTRTIEVLESAGCIADFQWIQPDPDNPQVVFNSLTANDNLIFEWDFGDGETSTLKSPAHQYDDFGTYEATLHVLGYGCTDNFTETIVLEEPVYCDAKFTWEQAFPQSRTINFVNQSFGENPAYTWDFGDGETSTEAAPAHTYSSAGEYTVKLWIETPSGCSDSTWSNLQILPPINLSGYVYAGESPISFGQVYLYKVNGNEQVQQTGRSPLTAGFFEFVDLVPGNYFVQAIPEYSFPYPVIPFYYPVYSGGVTQWQTADAYHTSSFPQDVSLNLGFYDDFFSGKAAIYGNVVQTGKTDDSPLLFYLSDGDATIYRFTIPDATGRFSFEDIPFGDYSLIPEKAGKTSESFEIQLSAENPEQSDIVFLETSQSIKPDLSHTGEKISGDKLLLLPNPADDHFIIQYPESASEHLQVKFVNPATGHTVSILSVKTGEKISTQNMPDGMYLVEIRCDEHTFSRKLIIRH